MKRLFTLFKCLVGATITNAQINAMRGANEAMLQAGHLPKYDSEDFRKMAYSLEALDDIVARV